MTIQTCGALIDIAGNLTVVIIHGRLSMFVTENTFEDGEITAIDVAISTVIPFFPMLAAVDRKMLPIVIPICRCPAAGTMAGFAGYREIGRGMIGIGCRHIVIIMAGITVARRAGILSINMTGCAINADMGAGQGKIALIVIKGGRSPGAGCVTGFASQWKSQRGVIGIYCRYKIVIMAGITVSWSTGILSVDMA